MGIIDGFMTKGDGRPYCSAAQLGLFKKSRDAGSISVFRVSNCVCCGVEIPKSKTFCSEDCWKKTKGI